MDEQIDLMDELLDAVEAAIERDYPADAHVLDEVRADLAFQRAKQKLNDERFLSPVLLDRLKQHAFLKIKASKPHPKDLGTLACLALLADVFGLESPELRAGKAIAATIKNQERSARYLASLNAAPATP